MTRFEKSIDYAHMIAERTITGSTSEPLTVVDATVGRGRDTAFLSKLVGARGRVYGFDVQQAAISEAKQYLADTGCPNNVTLFLSGHETITKLLYDGVDLALFNLGWLPGGDHSITTRAETTVTAVERTMGLLVPGGVITVCFYTGHAEGKREAAMVEDFLTGADTRRFAVSKIGFVNQPNDPPYLLIVQKIK